MPSSFCLSRPTVSLPCATFASIDSSASPPREQSFTVQLSSSTLCLAPPPRATLFELSTQELSHKTCANEDAGPQNRASLRSLCASCLCVKCTTCRTKASVHPRRLRFFLAERQVSSGWIPNRHACEVIGLMPPRLRGEEGEDVSIIFA